jgi:hypothetical protein
MRHRDFKSEYARRKARAAERGLSLSQARGHPRTGEPGLRPMKLDPKLEAALKTMRAGRTLKSVAAANAVSRERLSTYIKVQAGAARSGREWTFNDRRRRQVQVIHNGEIIEIEVEGYEPARLAGMHRHLAQRVIANPRQLPAFKRRWENVSVKATNGQRYTFTTDLNEIHRALHTSDRPFHQIYRLSAAQ